MHAADRHMGDSNSLSPPENSSGKKNEQVPYTEMLTGTYELHVLQFSESQWYTSKA